MSETWLTSLMSGALCALAAANVSQAQANCLFSLQVYTLSDHGILTEEGRQK